MKTLNAAEEAGADCLVLCDTNGGCLPMDFGDIYRAVKAKMKMPLGVHTHNDSGCAVANSMVAAAEGAVMIQGVINGFGERCGNANLSTIIPNLNLKLGIRVLSDENLGRMKELSVFVSEIANVVHDERQPYVGEAAFSHKGGAHIDGVMKVTRSFEHVDPETVGNARQYILSDQSGGSTIVEKLKRYKPNASKKDPEVGRLLSHVKAMEHAGYQFEAADGSFELLARKMLGRVREDFEFKGFRVIEEKRENGDIFSEATIKVKADGRLEHTAAEGDGPVNALDNALRKALVKFYPSLREVKLDDFKVRVLDGRDGTAAKVRVLIESSDGADRWGTIGVSTNVIEASWFALIDSLKYKLMKDRQLQRKK
jgi:2-isopropylmalate synthase